MGEWRQAVGGYRRRREAVNCSYTSSQCKCQIVEILGVAYLVMYAVNGSSHSGWKEDFVLW